MSGRKPSFGSIETRNHRTGTSYRAVWRLLGKKQSKTFDTYAEAFDYLEEMAINIRRGGAPKDVSKPRTQFSVLAEAWYSSRPQNEKVQATRGKERSILDARLLPAFGHRPIGEITRREVQDWVNRISEDPALDCPDCEAEQEETGDDVARCAAHAKVKPVAAASVASFYTILGQIMREAQLDGFLPNGCPVGKGLIKLPTIHGRMQFLTDEQVDHLLRVCLEKAPAHYAVVHLAAHTGMRQGELLGLSRSDYNPIGGHITVRRAAKRSRGNGAPVVGSTKTNRQRRIDLMPCCVEVLNAHLGAHEFTVVFPGTTGQPQNATNWRRRIWYPLREAAGFDVVNFHDLRHSHCSSILAAGWDVTIVAERMGHASTRMTLDVYAHAIPGRQKALLERHGIRAI